MEKLAPSRAYTPPRTRAGQPDLQGIWQVINAFLDDPLDDRFEFVLREQISTREG